MSAFTNPIVFTSSDDARLLERLPLSIEAEGAFDEKMLQKLLFRFPASLPVHEIDPHVGPLVAICRELETGAGPADILYATPSGKLVIVETKLWRNQEARRQVVGQILDYAKQLTTWSFQQLDGAASRAGRTAIGHLARSVRQAFPDTDEASFVDGVTRSLKTGDFLLLIVGDGIRLGAESLVMFLERYGHMRFGLGLIEVAAYRLPLGEVLLHPRVLAKTETLQKMVLVGPTGPLSFAQAAQAEDAITPVAMQREWFTTFWKGFLAKLQLDHALVPSEPAKGTNQYFPMPPSGSSAWVSAYIAQGSKRAGVYLTFSTAYERGPQVYEDLRAERDAVEQEFGGPLGWERSGDKVYVNVPTRSFNDLENAAEREAVVGYLADTTSRLVKVLRPRLQVLTQTD